MVNAEVAQGGGWVIEGHFGNESAANLDWLDSVAKIDWNQRLSPLKVIGILGGCIIGGYAVGVLAAIVILSPLWQKLWRLLTGT